MHCGATLPTLRQLVEEFLDCLVLAIVDDINILGPPLQAVQCFRRLLDLALRDGEIMRLDKCHMFSFDQAVMDRFQPAVNAGAFIWGTYRTWSRWESSST